MATDAQNTMADTGSWADPFVNLINTGVGAFRGVSQQEIQNQAAQGAGNYGPLLLIAIIAIVIIFLLKK